METDRPVSILSLKRRSLAVIWPSDKDGFGAGPDVWDGSPGKYHLYVGRASNSFSMITYKGDCYRFVRGNLGSADNRPAVVEGCGIVEERRCAGKVIKPTFCTDIESMDVSVVGCFNHRNFRRDDLDGMRLLWLEIVSLRKESRVG